MGNDEESDNTYSLLDEYGDRLVKEEKPNPEDYISRYSGSCIDSFKEGLKIQDDLVELTKINNIAIKEGTSKGLVIRIQNNIHGLIKRKKKISKN